MNTVPFILAWRYLSGRRLRALLTTFAIMLGVMLIFGMNSIIPTLMDSLRQSLQAASNEVDLTVQQQAGLPFDAALVREVADVPGVAAATPLLRRSFSLPAGSALSTLTVVGLEPETAQAVSPLLIEAGRFLEAGDESAMVLPASIAEQAGLGVGDTLVLPSSSGTTPFTIVGLSAAPSFPGTSEAFVPLADAQVLFNAPGQANAIEAMVASGSDSKAVAKAVGERLGERFTLQPVDAMGAYEASLALGQASMSLFGVIALAMGAFIIFNSFRTAVTERQRDIALLRAVGASRRTVLATLLAESLLLGLLGTLAGVALGYGLAWLGMMGIREVVGSSFGFAVGGVPFRLPLLALSLLLGVGTALIGGLLPAWSTTRVTPLEALRPSPTEVEQRRFSRITWVGGVLLVVALATLLAGQAGLAALGALLFLAGIALLTPLLLRPVATLLGTLFTLIFVREGMLAQGNLEREPGRAAVTASAVMIGLAVVVALAGLTTSVVAGTQRLVEQSFHADYLFMPASIVLSAGNIGAGPELVEAIRETPGIEEVASLQLMVTEAGGQGFRLFGLDPVSFPRVSGLLFSQGEPEVAYRALAEGEGMIVNGFTAAQLGVGMGNSITVATPHGPRIFPIVGIASDYLNMKAVSGFVSQQVLVEMVGPTNDVLLMANAAPGAEPAATLDALEETVAAFPAFTVTAADAWKATTRELLDGVVVFYYALMGILALPALLALANTLAMNVLERTRELGLLRAVGAARRQVQRMILAESLLLASVGTAFGILAGLWLGRALLIAMNASGFAFEYHFPAAGILLGIAIGLLFGVIAALLPARRAARLDIVRALRYE